MKKNNAYVSLPQSIAVCGYEIKKMPLGVYLELLELIGGLPDQLMAQCFPGETIREVVKKLAVLEDETLSALIMGATVLAPDTVIRIVSKMSNISREILLTDETIGADGLIAMIRAFIKVNRLGECVMGLQEILAEWMGQEQTGSSV